METIHIGDIPALIWGKRSNKVFIAVHGKMSCKENFEILANAADKSGYQVLSFDLPEHGELDGNAFLEF